MRAKLGFSVQLHWRGSALGFSRGEGIAACGRCRPTGATNSNSNRAINENLKYYIFLQMALSF